MWTSQRHLKIHKFFNPYDIYKYHKWMRRYLIENISICISWMIMDINKEFLKKSNKQAHGKKVTVNHYLTKTIRFLYYWITYYNLVKASGNYLSCISVKFSAEISSAWLGSSTPPANTLDLVSFIHLFKCKIPWMEKKITPGVLPESLVHCLKRWQGPE